MLSVSPLCESVSSHWKKHWETLTQIEISLLNGIISSHPVVILREPQVLYSRCQKQKVLFSADPIPYCIYFYGLRHTERRISSIPPMGVGVFSP